MNPTETPSPVTAPPRSRWMDWLVVLLLFLATALVVVWQNSRLAVLWDLSLVLENSYRISLGDVPYRDFALPYAPLTFLIQSALIKLAGRAFWHTVVYSAAVAGLATVITWRIVLNLLHEAVAHPRLLAFLLVLPLIPLGVYCIFPHPFYDPDCTFAILLGVLLMQRLERKSTSTWRGLFTGAVLVIPLFVKQNMGLAFLVSAVAAFVTLMAIDRWQGRSVRRYAIVLAAILAGLGLALLVIQFTAGLRNYWHWTIEYAASRRTPARGEMLGIYEDKMVLLWIAFIAAGAIVWWLNRRGTRVLMAVSALLIAAPFIWPAVYLLREPDASERAERLLAVWPVLLIASFVVAIATIKRHKGVALVLPFVVIAAVNGTFMSQQLWGSTYAIWPLFVILLASTVLGLSSLRLDSGLVPEAVAIGRTSPPPERLKSRLSWMLLPLTFLIAASLLISGGFYVRSHERLDYANLDDGALTRSTLPQLKGLSTRGDWIPDFEELVHYAEREIPSDDGILVIGEDPFHYATGRWPRFPVLLFDRTANPYTPEEILELARQRDIRWLIVKQDLQNEDDNVSQEKDQLTEALEQDFEQVESLKNYDIYRRNDSKKSDEDDDDKDK